MERDDNGGKTTEDAPHRLTALQLVVDHAFTGSFIHQNTLSRTCGSVLRECPQ